MRQFKAAGLASLLLTMLCAGTAHAQSEAQKEIEAHYAQIAAAAQKGEVAPLDKVATEDFKYVTILGKDGAKADWVTETKETAARFAAPTPAITVKLFTQKDNEATAVFGLKLTGDGTAPDGRMGTLLMERTERTTWTKAADGWKIKLAKHVMLETRLNKALVPFKRTKTEEDALNGVKPIYDAMGDVYSKQDWAAAAKFMPDNYPVTDASGAKLSKEEMMNRLKEGAKNLVNPIMFIIVQQMDLQGGMLTVVRQAKLISDIKLPDGKTSRLIYVSVARDKWKKGEKSWEGLGSDELHSEATLDGKMVPLAAFGGK